MKRAAIYARVSSDGQRDRHTIDSQLRVLPAFVASQGWTLAGTYIDDGRSAATGKLEARDGFHRLAAAAERGEFDVLVVVDVDRLTRTEDLRERAAILGVFQAAGVSIATPASGVLDLRTMMGELYVTLQAIFGAEENRKRAARIREGRITAVRRGRLPGGRPPWGLRFDPIAGAWSIDPVRGPLLRELFERVAAGESCRSLAHELEIRDAPHDGRGWYAPRVARLIRSRHAAGEWAGDRARGIAVSVPRIVSDELWQRAQAALDRSRCSGLRRTRHDYLLEGLGVCGACGALMGIRSHGGRRGDAAYYFCHGRRMAFARAAGRCAAPGVRVEDADARAWAAIRRELEDPELERAIAGEQFGQDGDRRDWETDAAGYRRKLDRLQAAERALLERFTRGKVGEVALDAELDRIANDRAALTAQLETAGRAAVAARDVVDRLRDARTIATELREALAEAPFAVRRALAEQLVRPGGVAFAGRDIRITLRVPRPASGVGSADGSAYGCVHDRHLRIRLVA